MSEPNPQPQPAPQPVDFDEWAQARWPLGANFDPDTGLTTFAVFAPAAQHVVLEIYPQDIGADASFTIDAVGGGDGIWRAQLSGAGHGTLYAYRAWGRNWPYHSSWRPGSRDGFVTDRDEDHNHFNPNKVLLDPYAREVTHTPMSPRLSQAGVDRGVFGTGGGQWRGQVRRDIDTGKWAPKGVVVFDETPTGTHPDRQQQDVSIYEVHIKSLTMHPAASQLSRLFAGRSGFEQLTDVPDAKRGTYAAAGLMGSYLRGLGMNTIEFLPVHQTDTDQVGDQPGTVNYWGYQTLNFFAPNRDYAFDKSPGGPTREFKQMVAALHEQGIGVFLDVVFNHTAEGGNWDGDADSASFTSFGGLATSEYYDLTPDGHLMDGATGSSNQTNFSSSAMSQLVIDSLLYWNQQLGVDGFRFDLAPVLGRFPGIADENDWGERRRFFEGHPLLRRITQIADDNRFQVIAEAWDLWGYEVGNFPPRWGEWNGHFRDEMRHYLKGDANARGFIEHFNGDWRHFNDKSGPQKSINFVTAHDGFTMMDLVSFNTKDNNQAYPFGPSDGGTDDNVSWDSGNNHALRRARWRNFWLVTFFARGVPMIVGGDEYGRTQNGNNNSWNLNTIGIWNNWAQAVSNAPTRLPVDPRDASVGTYYDVVGQTAAGEGTNPLFEFARYVAKLHSIDPTLRQRQWGDADLDDDDVSYLFYRPDLKAQPGDFDRQLAVFINGTGVGGTDYLFLVNMLDQPATFAVPSGLDPQRGTLQWLRLIDTCPNAEAQYNCWAAREAQPVVDKYQVEPWSIAVLAAATPDSPLFTG